MSKWRHFNVTMTPVNVFYNFPGPKYLRSVHLYEKFIKMYVMPLTHMWVICCGIDPRLTKRVAQNPIQRRGSQADGRRSIMWTPFPCCCPDLPCSAPITSPLLLGMVNSWLWKWQWRRKGREIPFMWLNPWKMRNWFSQWYFLLVVYI